MAPPGVGEDHETRSKETQVLTVSHKFCPSQTPVLSSLSPSVFFIFYVSLGFGCWGLFIPQYRKNKVFLPNFLIP